MNLQYQNVHYSSNAEQGQSQAFALVNYPWQKKYPLLSHQKQNFPLLKCVSLIAEKVQIDLLDMHQSLSHLDWLPSPYKILTQ